jgi:hypothetical protein
MGKNFLSNIYESILSLTFTESPLCQYLKKYVLARSDEPMSEDFQEEYIEYLDNHPAEINQACDLFENKPLHFAWMTAQPALVFPLLERGAKYVNNTLSCNPRIQGFEPQLMAAIINRPGKLMETIDPQNYITLEKIVQKQIVEDPAINASFIHSSDLQMREGLKFYNFFNKHDMGQFVEKFQTGATTRKEPSAFGFGTVYKVIGGDCGPSCTIVRKMMAGEVDCSWFDDATEEL